MSDGKVREWIGKDSYEMILNSVDSGILEPDQIRSLAYGLSKKVGGAHDMRMPRKVEADRDEMVRIFRGWYEKGNLHMLTTEQAVKRLIEVIKSDIVDFPPLAHALQKSLDSVHADHGGFVSNHPMDEYAEKARKVIGEAAWEFMMGAVDEGDLGPYQMKGLAFMLGKKVGGDHKQRLHRIDHNDYRREMMLIFQDWWRWTSEESAVALTSPVQRLVDLLETANIGNYPLANELKKTLQKKKNSPEQGSFSIQSRCQTKYDLIATGSPVDQLADQQDNNEDGSASFGRFYAV